MSSPLIFTLTDDLLSKVNEKLQSCTDKKTFRLVCKDFYRVESMARTKIRINRLEFLPGLIHHYKKISSLDLSSCPGIDDGTIRLLLSHDSGEWTRRLKVLNLSRCTGLRFSGLEILVRACEGLESVDLSHCWGIGDREASALSCGVELRELMMDMCLGVSDVGLAKIAVRCGKLERISLKWCKEISDLGIDLMCKKCLELKFLDLSYLKVTSESLKSVARLRKLEALIMVGCPMVNDVGLRFLEVGCPSLKEIDVSRCNSVTSAGIAAVVRGHTGLTKIKVGFCFSEISVTFVDCIKNLKDLNLLTIDGARVSDAIFEAISSNCNSLSEIGLSKCIGVTNIGIVRLVYECVNLKTLDLTCCYSITDAAIYAVAQSLRKLVCLKLESCNMITENSLKLLGSCCSLLEEIDLTDCCGINDKGLKYLSRCSRLVSLKLGLCTNISDKGLIHISSNCSNLQALDLYRCVCIGDGTLGALSRGCKKLKNLNLSYCNEITDRGMEFLGHLEELSDLEIRSLDKVTSVGLTAFAAGAKRIADLDLKHCGKIDDSGFWSLAAHLWNLRQINLSYCAISDVGLCIVMGNLTRLQDAKLVHLTSVTVEGYELALRACSVRIKKVKLDAHLRFLLSSEILEILHTRGCKIRWD